jgi:predicted transcriptional regulator
MKTLKTRKQINDSILRALSAHRMSRSEMMTVVMSDCHVSDKTIQTLVNDLISSDHIIREGKTSKQHYQLTASGYIAYVSSVSNSYMKD